jgi:hypothetical protein
MSIFSWFTRQLPNRASRKLSGSRSADASQRGRALRLESLEERCVLSCAAAPCWLQVTLTTTDLAGAPITSIEPGGEFKLQATVSDVRVYPDGFLPWYPSTAPVGTFAAYDDVTYDPSLVAVDGAISYGPVFESLRTPDEIVLATPGTLDEIGAVSFSHAFTGTPSPALLFSVPFTADAAGVVNFSLNPADNLPANNSLLFGLDGAVPIDKIDFVNATIAVTAPSVQDQIAQLTEQVNALVSSGVLSEGNGNALISKLSNAATSFTNSNNNAGINKIEAFIHQVNAFLSAGSLTSAEAQSLVDAADEILDSTLT